MHRPATFIVLLGLCFSMTGSLAYAQGDNPPDVGARSATKSATEAEVEQLRHEVAELRAIVQRLVEASGHQGSSDPRFMLAKAVVAAPKNSTETAAADVVLPAGPGSSAEASPAEPFSVLQEKKDQKTAPAPVTAGWNGEHFFIKSADGQFQIQPYGYVQTDFRSYTGDGAPADTFAIRRGRFGFQGNYGDHFQFGILVDAAATTGATIRDIYLNAKYNNAIQIQAGQFKEPFAQELAAGVTNIDFVERGLQSLLYPSAASAYRSPGVVIHGDIKGGAFQYWAGAFNGKGFSTNNTTSVPETVGRVRFYPWRDKKDSALQGLAFGGSIAYSQARGLSNELTPNTGSPAAPFTFFPQFQANGNVWRYEGEFTYLKGPWGFRDEYVQAIFDRTGVGTLTLGGLGFSDLPAVRFKAWNSAATYLLTKERRPENGTPRIKHAVFGPELPGGGGRGWGAWELGFRYSGIQGNEPGIFFNNVFTPQNVPAFSRHTDEFSFGVNWYLNYWVRFQSNVNVDRLKQPSTIGAVPQNYLVFEQRLQYRF
jgi:phosphate-selective porin OprO/OprP